MGINIEFEVGVTEVRLLESVSLVSFWGGCGVLVLLGGGGKRSGREDCSQRIYVFSRGAVPV